MNTKDIYHTSHAVQKTESVHADGAYANPCFRKTCRTDFSNGSDDIEGKTPDNGAQPDASFDERARLSSLHDEHDGSTLTNLKVIETFVAAVGRTSDLGFVIGRKQYGKSSVIWLGLAKRFYQHMGGMLSAVRPDRWYTPSIQAFFDACSEIGIVSDQTFHVSPPYGLYGMTGKVHAEVFNELITCVRRRCGTREYREKMHRREEKTRRNIAKGLAFERAMFEWRSRHLILVLTLGFKRKHWSSVTLDDLREYRDQFLNNRRMNALLRGIDGYLWKIEFGELSGLHMHVIIFYSSESQRDVYIAQKLGEYWERVVTKGVGSYWNSNARRVLHRTYGHGEGSGKIDASDLPRRSSLRRNIEYLAKSGQYLLEKNNENIKTFGTSRAPKKLRLADRV